MTDTAKKATAKKAPAKKAAAKKVASPSATAEAKAAAGALKQRVKPDKDISKQVPPVQTHEALNAINSEDRKKPKTETVDVEFIYPAQTDPNRRIPGPNPYLDDVERARAEIVRAEVEGREPDLENPGAHAGTGARSKDAFLNSAPAYANTEGITVEELPVVVVKD